MVIRRRWLDRLILSLDASCKAAREDDADEL